MKTRIFSMPIALLIMGMLIGGCGDKTTNNSKDIHKDFERTNEKIKQNVQETTADIKAEVSADWERFKATSNEVIENSEKEIKDLRVKISKADKKQRAILNKKLDDLEQKNNELKTRIAERTTSFKKNMVEFNEMAKENQQAVQRELKYDMDELGKAIKNLFQKNTD